MKKVWVSNMQIYCNFNYAKNVLNLEQLYFIVQERYLIKIGHTKFDASKKDTKLPIHLYIFETR